MKDPIQPFLDGLPRAIQDPDQRRNVVTATKKAMSENDGDKKHVKFLKNEDDLEMVMKFIKNKKLSNRQIKSKIREYLNDPEELTDFLKSLLKKVDTKKVESKEATGTGAGVGAFEPPFSGEYKPSTNVPTVRESKEKYCDACDRVKSKCICDEPKKMETKEATDSSSSGQYSTNSIWSKSLKKKDWGPSRKTQIPGGQFVQVKKKCKKFPYCNQGDINALRIFENESVQSVIESVSGKYGVGKDIISDIVFEEIRKTQR
jgi:hypothetical protein